VQSLNAFDFTLRDLRGPSGLVEGASSTSSRRAAGHRSAAPGHRLRGQRRQGTDPTLIVQSYRTTSHGEHVLSAASGSSTSFSGSADAATIPSSRTGGGYVPNAKLQILFAVAAVTVSANAQAQEVRPDDRDC